MTIYTSPSLLGGPRWRGLRIGLLGGSFNPPHIGHVHISLAAMKGLALDCVWWLVSPQNPLKSQSPGRVEDRAARCRELTDPHPRLIVSELEAEFGTRYTFDTIRRLKTLYPHQSFVWISGMDNALSLHRWNRWRELLELVPMVHLARKPASSLICRSPVRLYGKQRHVVLETSGRWPLEPGTTYWMLQDKMVNISSTEIRENRLDVLKV